VLSSGDEQALSSPLAGLETEGLLAALERLGHRVRRVAMGPSVPDRPAGQDRFAVAADFGRRLGARWETDPPDLVLCDGYLSGLAAHAAAPGRVVLWLGTPWSGRSSREHRLALAVARSAAAVWTSTSVTAEWAGGELPHPVVLPPPIRRPAPGAAAVEMSWRPGRGRAAAPPAVAVVVDSGRGEQAADGVLSALRQALPDGSRVGRLALDEDGGVPVAGPAGDVTVAVTGLSPGWGRSTLAAMARGLAVVCLPRLPDRDLVIDGVTGLIAPTGRALSALVRGLVADPFRREALGHAGYDRVEAVHADDVVAARISFQLQALLPSRTRPAL
jgi:hypothetical protein